MLALQPAYTGANGFTTMKIPDVDGSNASSGRKKEHLDPFSSDKPSFCVGRCLEDIKRSFVSTCFKRTECLWLTLSSFGIFA